MAGAREAIAHEFKLPCGHIVDEAFLTDRLGDEKVSCPFCFRFCLTQEQAARLVRPCMICARDAPASDDASFHVTPCLHVICRQCLIIHIQQASVSEPVVVCSQCETTNHILESECLCGLSVDANALLLCPLCRKSLGFAWAQREVNIYWTLPGIYDKLDPTIKAIVCRASLPEWVWWVSAVIISVLGVCLFSCLIPNWL